MPLLIIRQPVKEIVHPKNENLLKLYSPSGHPRCRWICFFLITDLEKYSITSLAHNGSSAVNGLRSKHLIQINMQIFTSQDIKLMDWSVLYELFGLLLTAPIHCRGSIGYSFTPLDGFRGVVFSANCHFGWSISLISIRCPHTVFGNAVCILISRSSSYHICSF